MSWYATGQLARQRQDEFAAAARQDELARLARGVPVPSDPVVRHPPFDVVQRVASRIRGRLRPLVARRDRSPRAESVARLDGHAVGSRNA